MKPLPDFETSFEAFYSDFVLRSLDLREWVAETLGSGTEDVAVGLGSPFRDARGAVRTLFEQFWREVSTRCLVTVAGTAVPPERIGYHARFGWAVEANGVRAHLGKPSLLEGVKVEMGNRSYISGGSLIRGANRLRIGAYTSIAEGLYANTFRDFHPMAYPSTYNFNENRRLREDGLAIDLAYDFLEEAEDGIAIGSDVWIGRSVRLSHGSSIADGCVVAENSLVRGVLEPYGIYGGSPAKLIRRRFPDATVAALLDLRWWTWPHILIARNRRFFATDLTKFHGELARLIDAWPVDQGGATG